jgi:hypothetical protein
VQPIPETREVAGYSAPDRRDLAFRDVLYDAGAASGVLQPKGGSMRVIAYLDPGTGSIIVSAVVAGFAGIGVMFRSMGRKISSPFRRKSKTETVAE